MSTGMTQTLRTWPDENGQRLKLGEANFWSKLITPETFSVVAIPNCLMTP
jgi:hypothetical protein